LSELLCLSNLVSYYLGKVLCSKRSHTTWARYIYCKIDYVYSSLKSYFHIWVPITWALL